MLLELSQYSTFSVTCKTGIYLAFNTFSWHVQLLHAFCSLPRKNEFFIQKVYFKLGVSFLPYPHSPYSHCTSYRNSASSRVFWFPGSVPRCLTPWVSFNPLALVPGATQILDLLCTHRTALAAAVVKNEKRLELWKVHVPISLEFPSQIPHLMPPLL